MKISIFLIAGIFGLTSHYDAMAQIDFFTTFGLSERITPIYLGRTYTSTLNIVVPYDEHDQLTGNSVCLSVGLKENLTGLVFEYGQTYRYDHVYYETPGLAVTQVNIVKSVEKFIFDHHLLITKFFHKGSFYFGPTAGFSLMNNGTNYSYLKFAGISQNDSVYMATKDNFSYNAWSFGFSCQIKNICLKLTGYYAEETNFNRSIPFILPEISIRYNLKLCPFKKN